MVIGIAGALKVAMDLTMMLLARFIVRHLSERVASEHFRLA
jgi:hypothetical protein